MPIKKKPLTGFTLAEILVYAAVLSIVIAALAGSLLWFSKSYLKLKAQREVQESAARAMAMIIHEIREAKSIYTPTTNSSQLSLETDNLLPEDESSAFVEFYLCGASALCLKRESEDPYPLTSANVIVRDLEFSLLAASSSVQISFQALFEDSDVETSFFATSSASLRNY